MSEKERADAINKGGEPIDFGTTKFGSGAVRSDDVADLSFTSLPWVGLFGVARTAGGEGAAKYGRYNYMQGMPVHDLLDHTVAHVGMFLLGDRSEPHLEHAAWGLLAAIQSYTLDPEAAAPHLLGPGATITPAMQKHLDEEAPILAEKRKNKKWVEKLGEWKLAEVKGIAKLLEQRASKRWTKLVNSSALEYIKRRKESIAEITRPVQEKSTRTESHSPVSRDFGPGSTNEKVYGRPTRTEPAVGNPAPEPGETWSEYEDGTRAYYRK